MPDLAATLPSALRRAARWERLGQHNVPVMLVHPDWDSERKAPLVLWMHGRTAHKEIDPGRYLRWMRAGIGACAIDLPGHGERLDLEMHKAENAFEVVLQMESEIDSIVQALGAFGVFDLSRMGIGGMSGGGMAAMTRLTREHPFACASVEATSGSWDEQRTVRPGPSFRAADPALFHAKNPIENLTNWREVPFQAIHSKGDQWVSVESQRKFIASLRNRYSDPSIIEMIEYENTGAPYEHAGFGRMSADAKNRQNAFFQRWLLSD